MTTAHYTGVVSGTKPATGIGAAAQYIEMTVTPNFAGAAAWSEFLRSRLEGVRPRADVSRP